QEALLESNSTTKQKVESAVADEERYTAQANSRSADLSQARTALRSNELAAEAERRTDAVLESQEMQLVADLHAKHAALAGATGTSWAPPTAPSASGRCVRGSWCRPAPRCCRLSTEPSGCRPTSAKPS